MPGTAMKSTLERAGLLALVLGLLALPAAAQVFESYTVTLRSGESFESRYEPQPASWDPEMLELLTVVGNRIAVPMAEVEAIESARDAKGFGVRLDANTLVVGFVANDGDADGGKRGFYQQPEAQNQRSFDLDQFVEPGDAGGGGLPLYGNPGLYDTSGGGAGGGAATPPAAPVQSTGGGGGGGAAAEPPPSQ